jgi:hypothetical protein
MAAVNSSDTMDDVAILDITTTADDDGDKQPLLSETNQINGSVLSTPHVDMVLVPSINRYRLTNILRSVAFIEFLTLFIIWLVGKYHFLVSTFYVCYESFLGGSTHWLVDDIIHYRLSTSVFDLVAVSLCKLVLLILFLTELETFIVARLYQPNARAAFIAIRYIYTGLLLLISACSLAFAIVKFVVILRQADFSKLYLSSVYLFLIFSSMELIGMVLMIPYLSRLKLLEQPRSAEKKKKVDLVRLFSLAKSERLLIGLGTLFLILSSATQIAQPYYFGKIVDDAVKADSMSLVNRSVLILLAINGVGAVASFFRSWLFELAGQ